MIARAFYGLFWAYVCLIAATMFISPLCLLLGGPSVLLVLLDPKVFIYAYMAYCIYRIRDINPNFKTSFWFACALCAESVLQHIVSFCFYSSSGANYNAWLTNTFGILFFILSCLTIWFLCDGIYSLANQSNITSLITKANYRKYLYVISESIFMIWWLYFNYIMSHDPAEIQNKLPLIMSALAIYPVMILHIISVLLLVLLFRQTAKEL